MENFSKEHREELDKLVLSLVWNNDTISLSIGQTANVYELVNNTSINTLKKTLNNVTTSISRLSGPDKLFGEFSLNKETSTEVDKFKMWERFLVLLIVKKTVQETSENTKKDIVKLESELNALKENTKTPDQKMAELQAEIDSKKKALID